MEFSLEQPALNQTLGELILTAGAEASIAPIYKQVRIEALSDRVVLCTQDTQVCLLKGLLAQVKAPGACCVDIKRLHSLVKNMGATKPVKFKQTDETTIKVTQGRARYSLCGTDPFAFKLPDHPEGEATAINPESLLEAITKVAYSAYPDDDRGALKGILLEPSGDEGFFRAVASDGHRLATYKAEGVINESVILIPRAFAVLKKLLSKSEEASFVIDKNFVHFLLDEGLFKARLLTEDFPNYRNIIPKGTSLNAVVNRAETIKVLKRIELFAVESITIEVDPSGVKLSVTSTLGEASEEVALEDESNVKSKITTMINATFMRQALEKFGDDNVTIKLFAEDSPVVLMARTRMMALIMPMKR